MFRKLVLASAVSLALVPPGADAMGLGGIRAQSALYEPFVGEIDLVDVQPDDLDALKVGLAPDTEFTKVGAARSHFLTSLRFKAQVSPQGRPIIRVTSEAAIREPYLDFLVEVNSRQGRLVKEYTVLLDPPTTVKRAPPRVRESVVGKAVVSKPVSAPKPPQKEPPAPESTPRAPASVAAGFPLRYGPVEAGTGLWRVARSASPPGATVAQTAMAFYRSNQGAFVGSDINKLQVGATLEIPSSAELFALDAAAAEREFSAALRGRPVTTAPLVKATAEEQSQGARLKIAEATSSAEQRTAGTAPAGHPGSESKLGSIKDELLLVQEAGESTRQETEELRGRIRELETQLTDIRKLLTLRNEQLAQLQAVRQEDTEVKIAEETGVLPAGATVHSPDQTTPVTPEAADVSSDDAAQAPLPEAASSAAPGVPPATPEVPQEANEAPSVAKPEGPEAPGVRAAVAEKADKPADVTSPAEKSAAGPMLAQAASPKAAEPMREPVGVRHTSATEEDEPPAFWQSLSTPTLAVALGVPALLLPLGWLMMRRRKQLAEEFEASQLATVAIPRSPGSSASTLGETPYASDTDVLGATSESPYSAFDNLEDETAESDVASEADVYIAYGRYREAEYLLQEELSRAPERLDLKFKLAEAYFGAKNLDALTKIKDEIESAGGDRLYEAQWRRLSSMVRDLEGAGSEGPAQDDNLSAQEMQRDVGVIGLPSAAAEPRAAASTSALEADPHSVASDFTDLSLSSERPSGADQNAETEGQSAGAGLELELDDLAAFDLDLERVAKENEMAMARGGDVVTARSEEGPLEAPYLDWPEPDADTDTDAESESLDVSQSTNETPATDMASSQWQTDSSLWDEVSTKIDLARAYMDMADPDAARAILEEVAEEGNDAQRAEAQEMLSRLG
jgi:pilus assembly protein FimV